MMAEFAKTIKLSNNGLDSTKNGSEEEVEKLSEHGGEKRGPGVNGMEDRSRKPNTGMRRNTLKCSQMYPSVVVTMWIYLKGSVLCTLPGDASSTW